ncbi:hypothetical protein A8990_13649 [Paenibacillus taihuensis]|uniref:Uncharacterized protein n=1 Tax=Paenibacillus taihuensis TaxID=1156355 RepID=A0A3D9R233_9BACL|nr:hypothetical protein [Paenibacillus taihuensis]REE68783.1 hypothetical protein A8990_13649 [Paenibacillus taihuensis]
MDWNLGFSLGAWITYTMWAVLGIMIIDFLTAFIPSFWKGTFDTTFLGYLKDILYYVLPLNFLLSMVPIDPTEYTLIVLFFLGGASVIFKYVMDIIKRFRTQPDVIE